MRGIFLRGGKLLRRAFGQCAFYYASRYIVQHNNIMEQGGCQEILFFPPGAGSQYIKTPEKFLLTFSLQSVILNSAYKP